MSDYLDPNNEELLRDFFEEAQLQIDLMEQNILVLENDPSDQDSVDELFRAAHTLKGGAATVRMDELAGFTHLVEDILDEVRRGSFRLTPTSIDIILTAIDVIKLMLEARTEGRILEDTNDVQLVKESLKTLIVPESAATASSEPESKIQEVSASAESKASVLDDIMSDYEFNELFDNSGPDEKVYRVKVYFEEDTLMNTVGGIQVFSILKNIGIVLKTTPDFEILNEDIYHPHVFYYLSTHETVDTISKKVTISDVTTDSQIFELNRNMIEELAHDPDIEHFQDYAPMPSLAEEVAESSDVSPLSQNEVDLLLASSVSAPVQETLPPTSKFSTPAVVKKSNSKKDISSILRVDSRKIDQLLNMVSESVINKSTINKVAVDLAAHYTSYQSLIVNLENNLRSLIDSIPEIIRQASSGLTTREILDQYRKLGISYLEETSQFETTLKKTVFDMRNVAQKMSINTANMQEGIMKIRMVPISNIFSRFPRLVRDLSHSLSKNVDLKLEGEDTELDKSVIEDLLDPLIHCVRNSIDHGIETPEIRKQNGKNETGTVTLRASNEGSMILIEITDDGKGINSEAVYNKAVAKGLISKDAKLSETEIFELIYAPGFSTSSEISSVSGRGVGMDVVKTQIEKLKGNIVISSAKGAGTKISIRLPLTLAIIRGLLVRVGEECYSIPVSSVIDSHRIMPEDVKILDNYEMFNVRDELIFLSRLSRIFNIDDTSKQVHKYVVIVGSAERKMGLVVDQLIGEEDVVIKPLKDDFSNSYGIAGATILGDGKVSLIVDVTQLLDYGVGKVQDINPQNQARIGKS